MKNLEGAERQQLRRIFLRLLSLSQFDRLLDSLDVDRESIGLGDDKEEIFFKVITEANKAQWLATLVEAVRKYRPRDPELYDFANIYYALGIRGTPTQAAFERIVVPAHPFLPFGEWNTRAGTIERQVCRIHFPVLGGTANGTGFLVGPSAVITNYHVIEPILEDKATADRVTVQFDYKVVGNEPQKGRSVKLNANWLIDSSPYAASDEEAAPSVFPTEEQLDYAILRLAEPVGDQPIGIDDPKAQPRGWLHLADASTTDPQRSSPVMIVQHPKGHPLSLAMEMDGVQTVNGNSTRFRYNTNTEGGSSGSPVFDIDWTLIGLHHVGDPDDSTFHRPEYNQGITMHKIVALLKKRDKVTMLER
jgi:hypothetical protein